MSVIVHKTNIDHVLTSETWDKKGDLSQSNSFEETWFDAIGANARRDVLNGLGYDVSINLSEGIYTLSATIGNGGGENEPEPEAEWAVKHYNIEKNILESNLDIATILPTEVKERILLKLKNPGKDIAWSSQTVSAPIIAAAQKVYKIMRLGVENRPFRLTNVSRTIYVSRRYLSTWQLVNNGKILSKSVLLSSASLPAYVSIILPNTFNINLGDAGFAYAGYMENPPEYRPAPNSQVAISQEWIYNHWLVDAFNQNDFVT